MSWWGFGGWPGESINAKGDCAGFLQLEGALEGLVEQGFLGGPLQVFGTKEGGEAKPVLVGVPSDAIDGYGGL